MITAIDTNILLDILFRDEEFFQKSSQLLERQSALGALIISPLVYTELLSAFFRLSSKKPAEDLDAFLEGMGVQVSDLGKNDLVLSADRWSSFSTHRKMACPKCGAATLLKCGACGQEMHWRNHIITDFLIGAHAQNNANALITRDRGYYRRYFKIKIFS